MKRLIIIAFMASIFILPFKGAGLAVCPGNWIQMSGPQYNMVVEGDIYIDGTKISKAGYCLGAFGPAGETDCRATSEVYNDGYYYLTVVSNTNGEAISFKIYDQSHGKSYDVIETVVFQSDGRKESFNLNVKMPVVSHILTIVKAGEGSLTPGAGSYSYAHGARVDLSATPGSGSSFNGWSGDASSTDAKIAITMDSDKKVTATFAVTVIDVDRTPPVVTCPNNITAQTTDGQTVNVTYPAATASDDKDPNPVISYSLPSGSKFSVGTTTVTATATDKAGNKGQCTFAVTVKGGGQEICDGKDNDADASIDEGFDVGKTCSVGIGECQRTGAMVCKPDGTGTKCSAEPGQPQTEICDGKDNDCDGQIDEGALKSYYEDSDEDKYGNPSKSIQACSAPSSHYVTDNTDCNDSDKDIHPGASEISCNGKDDDCTGGDKCDQTTKCTESDSGSLDIGEATGQVGDEVRIPVRIQSAPNEVSSLGCDITYDKDVLEYLEYEEGDLVGSSFIFRVSKNKASPGLLIIGGYSYDGDGIQQKASGNLAWLKFKVKGGKEGECYTLKLERLIDGLANFSQTGGCFCIQSITMEGDLTGDNLISPADALAAFKCFLGTASCPDGVDINKDGMVSPADALCLFQKYLEQPSCLDLR